MTTTGLFQTLLLADCSNMDDIIESIREICSIAPAGRRFPNCLTKSPVRFLNSENE